MGSLYLAGKALWIRIWQALTLAVVASSLSACSVLGLTAPWDKPDTPDHELIASNLVNSISQFPHLNPLMATVQVAKPRSAFDHQVHKELDGRGFKLETVAIEEGLNQVKSAIKRVDGNTGSNPQVYVLAIGQVSVERAYDVVADRTVPVSEQIIRGVEERTVTLNDDIFEVPDSTYSSVSFQAYEGPKIEDMLAATAPGSKAGSWWKREKQTAVKKNMYETMTSNYKDVFTGYEDVQQSILIFPNDSLRLGDANKQIIDEYVAKMDPDTDVLSVIGCSHGETGISNGNSLLALGRANRVKEAFLFSGLEHDQILDEGCWAPQTFDDVMPRRGVVLTLKRQKNS